MQLWETGEGTDLLGASFVIWLVYGGELGGGIG